VNKYLIFAVVFIAICASTVVFGQTARVKDIASVDGVRSNQLVGYGLVVGLQGTGDSQQSKFTPQSVANMLATFGINVPAATLKVKNVAAVMITAALPPFARPGTTIDVMVSSLGDCASLQGGTLLQSPLKAANGDVYAVAQGSLSIGGFSAGGGGGSSAKNHTTVGRIPNGALVEKETSTQLAKDDIVSIALNQNDFTCATRMAKAINEKVGPGLASASDGNVVTVKVPAGKATDIVAFISEIEQVEVATDTSAKVIVNERTGTVVIGGSVRMSPVAISHGSLTVEVTKEPDVSQPNPLSYGKTEVTTTTAVTVQEQPAALLQIKNGSTIDELVRALNALKVTPRDLIAVLQAVKEAGALQAQLEVI
jgi:flagellar P-ring protein precursor FlgI